VIGDDAPQMLILDTAHRIIDSIGVFEGEERIPKERKADLESSFILRSANKNYLIAFGSFSTPQRNKLLISDLDKRNIQIRPLALPAMKEINMINIEGSALIGKKLVLSNRSIGKNGINHLIICDFDLDSGITSYHLIQLNVPGKEYLAGISGLCYQEDLDLLLFTASTEFTEQAYTDGAIGKSYLGYIRNMSEKLEAEALKPDEWIDLSEIFKGRTFKIESLTFEVITDTRFIIHLAADNDNGQSSLFKLKLNMKP
jgi:hypothetical protein